MIPDTKYLSPEVGEIMQWLRTTCIGQKGLNPEDAQQMIDYIADQIEQRWSKKELPVITEANEEGWNYTISYLGCLGMGRHAEWTSAMERAIASWAGAYKSMLMRAYGKRHTAK